ncbi:MAG: tRNA pseudouridine(55) synthase TruB [Solobacterium sp.]|jgi:tRNA pseudouridine55 synthase|nr:tRNA pseudouridine(55) synthase TruB [Solobacterium sp.]
MDAVILLNKPAGITSFDAVARCRMIFHERRIGHTGTLDPNASGLLIILMGRYTKYLPYCVSNHKQYHAGFSFGSKTDTGDIWGKVTDTKEPKVHSLEEIQHSADLFMGDTMQVPPMYSALKVNGKKLYELAREGKEVERQPRPVHIEEMTITETADHQYLLDANVSSGTYIRTLIEDLGAKLDEYATMTSLVRTGIEGISLKDACNLDELSVEMEKTDIRAVIDPKYPQIEADDKDAVIHGRNVRLEIEQDEVMLMDRDRILAVYQRVKDDIFHCERGLG